MKKLLALFSAILLFHLVSSSQTITDDDKRSFDDRTPIHIDVDGDQRADTIFPRTYKEYPKRSRLGRKVRAEDIKVWITFDLATTRGRRIKSFFRYKYGTAEHGGGYWVYALGPAGDINKDGRTDLIFYAGDDTSDETVELINRVSRFVVRSRKVQTADDWVKEK